jgi:hypothetical protein
VLALLLLAALSAAAPAMELRVVEVSGAVRDAALAEDERALWLSRTTAAGVRELVRLGADGDIRLVVPVPRGAVAFDACPGRGLVFADAEGIVDRGGVRLLSGQALLSVPDPLALSSVPLCGRQGAARGELRLVGMSGLMVQHPDGSEVTLPFPPRARSYSGSAHRGLLAQRPYAVALSLYAPHLLDADVDGDGREDLVLAHEGRVGVFLRGADGKLSRLGEVRDLSAQLGGSDVSVRVLAVDLTERRGQELLLSVTKGAMSERSAAFLLEGHPSPLQGPPALLWRRSGLSVPLGTLAHDGRELLVVGEIDTNLMQLGAALVTGEVPLKVALVTGKGAPRTVLTLKAEADVRAGRMAGAMPIMAVDLDGDGRHDLLDFGVAGKASLYPGSAGGLSAKPSQTWSVAPFADVIPLPGLPGFALLGEPGPRATTITLLVGPARSAKESARSTNEKARSRP